MQYVNINPYVVALGFVVTFEMNKPLGTDFLGKTKDVLGLFENNKRQNAHFNDKINIHQ